MPVSTAKCTERDISGLKYAGPVRVWGKAELRAHYKGWSWPRILKELQKRVGLRFTRGQRPACDLSDVEVIDRQLNEEADSRRAFAAVALKPAVGDSAAEVRRAMVRRIAMGGLT